jgi:hypothetical protein
MQKLQEKGPGRVQNGGGSIPILHKTGAGRVPSLHKIGEGRET